MEKAIINQRVRQCFKCSEDAEFFCVYCSCNMCFQCEEKHAYDLKTIDHNVKIYRDKFNCIVKEEVCLRHSNMFYIKYCKLCQLPFCYHCRKHKNTGNRAFYQHIKQSDNNTKEQFTKSEVSLSIMTVFS